MRFTSEMGCRWFFVSRARGASVAEKSVLSIHINNIVRRKIVIIGLSVRVKWFFSFRKIFILLNFVSVSVLGGVFGASVLFVSKKSCFVIWSLRMKSVLLHSLSGRKAVWWKRKRSLKGWQKKETVRGPALVAVIPPCRFRTVRPEERLSSAGFGPAVGRRGNPKRKKEKRDNRM